MAESSHVHPINILDIKRPNERPSQPILGFDVAEAFPSLRLGEKRQQRQGIGVSVLFIIIISIIILQFSCDDWGSV